MGDWNGVFVMIDEIDKSEIRRMVYEEVRLQLADALQTLANQLREPATGWPAPSMHDPKLIAILTAAATAALGQQVVVKKVTAKPRRAAPPPASVWAEIGRVLVQSSHNLHRGG